MEQTILELVNRLIGWQPLVDQLIVFLGQGLPYVLIILLIVALIRPGVFGLTGRGPVVVALIAAGLARFGLKEVVVYFFDRPRPFEVLEVTQLIEHSTGGSFPSGHMIFFFALATVLIFSSVRLGVGLMITTGLIGLARLAAGLHFLGDIVAGIGLGVLVGLAVYVIWIGSRVIGRSRLQSFFGLTRID